MTDTSADLEAVERSRITALVDGDLDIAGPLHAEDFHFVSLIGSTLTKADYFGALVSGRIKYIVWDPGVMTTRVSGDAGVVRYKARLQNVIGGVASASQEVWQTHYYERRAGQWRVVWSQATEVR